MKRKKIYNGTFGMFVYVRKNKKVKEKNSRDDEKGATIMEESQKQSV